VTEELEAVVATEPPAPLILKQRSLSLRQPPKIDAWLQTHPELASAR